MEKNQRNNGKNQKKNIIIIYNSEVTQLTLILQNKSICKQQNVETDMFNL